jgi:hypothetical protein
MAVETLKRDVVMLARVAVLNSKVLEQLSEPKKKYQNWLQVAEKTREPYAIVYQNWKSGVLLIQIM